MRDELLALASRVEALTGPCRETDIAILTHPAFGYRDISDDGSLFDRGNDGYWSLEGEGGFVALPSPTASLDAAMTLVLEGYDWIIGHTNSGLTIYAEVGGTGGDFTRFAATPALALTAAALRTIAAQGSE